MMATAIDFEAERGEIKRALHFAKRERDRDYLRMRSGEEGGAENYRDSNAKVQRLEEDLAAIDGAARLDEADRAAAAEAERLRERGEDANEVRENLSVGLPADAAELAE